MERKEEYVFETVMLALFLPIFVIEMCYFGELELLCWLNFVSCLLVCLIVGFRVRHIIEMTKQENSVKEFKKSMQGLTNLIENAIKEEMSKDENLFGDDE